MSTDALALLPEIVLALGAVLGLLVGSFSPPGREGAVRGIGIVAAVAAAVVTLVRPGATTAFGGTFVVDAATDTVRVVVAGAVVATLVLAGDVAVGAGKSPSCH